ncbi:MAG: restriction endonuclease subunit S [Bryobacterales bacterium]|nr:restriction endonuclease subunit S [Bryobacterales bacterium]
MSRLIPAPQSNIEELRLKWVLKSVGSGKRNNNNDGGNQEEVLSIGGEHIGRQGEWVLDNPRYISLDDFASMSSGSIQENDILLVKDGATIGKTAIADPLPFIRAAVNEHVFLLRVSDDNCPRYYFYVMQSSSVQDQIWREVRGSAQPGLTSEFRNNVIVPKPSKKIQQEIANYLDHETTRLDALVVAKERILELLRERHQALITRAITRGIDPNVSARASGIPWLGNIPKHWQIERARWLFDERDERSASGDEELLTVSHLTGVTPRSEKQVYMFEAETTEGYKICLKDDLVVNTLWAWMGAMGVAPVNGIVSPSYHVYKLTTRRLYPDFVNELVRLTLFAQEVTRYSKGVWSSRLRLYPEGFFEVFIPVPPKREQEEILSFLQEERHRLHDLETAVERAIALLRERRAALIAAAVNGRIEVKRAA